jgi:hypothetical protein
VMYEKEKRDWSAEGRTTCGLCGWRERGDAEGKSMVRKKRRQFGLS